MDTSGKGGTVRHVVGQVDPGGVHVVAFGQPTPEELAHDFLWRIRKELPHPGMLAVFDRSHYEDVVAVRVRGSVDRRTWSRRYAAINRFEERLAAGGTVIVKCFLHISPEEQLERLLARLNDPTKHWKYNRGDVEDRARWAEFQRAYADAIERCSAGAAPGTSYGLQWIRLSTRCGENIAGLELANLPGAAHVEPLTGDWYSPFGLSTSQTRIHFAHVIVLSSI